MLNARLARRNLHPLLSLLLTGFISILFWAGFNTSMEAAHSLEFGTGCHEMRDTLYEEYKERAHYSNRTDVRLGAQVVRKAEAGF